MAGFEPATARLRIEVESLIYKAFSHYQVFLPQIYPSTENFACSSQNSELAADLNI